MFRSSRGGRVARLLRPFSCLALLGLAPALAGATVHLRVDQLGVTPGQPARAWLMASPKDRVDGVDVVDAAGRVVGQATVGVRAATWGLYRVRPLAFTIASPGSYHLVARGSSPSRSPDFPVDAPSARYADALRHALALYQVQRDGPDFVPGPLRTAPAHLNDAQATAYRPPVFDADDNIVGPLVPTGRVIDASGGWADAGDYLKFVETASYVVGSLLTGVRDFPAEMDASRGGVAAFDAEARFGLEWLLRMWDDDTGTLFYQVGLGTGFKDLPYVSDHDLWRLPQADDTIGGDDPSLQYIRHRPVLQAGDAGSPVSPNLAGRLSAAFALGAHVFAERDPAFAARCLAAAVHVHALADRRPRPGPLLSVSPFDFYGESTWSDDMEWGATELALTLRAWTGDAPKGLPAEGAAGYLREAAAWASRVLSEHPAGSDPLGVYDTSALAHHDLLRGLEAWPHDGGASSTCHVVPADLAVTPDRLREALVAPLRTARRTALEDPFGFGTTWANWDSTSRGLGLAVMAAQAASVSDGGWAADSRAWLGNVLGANAWGLSLLVGDGTSFPECLQHQIANLVGSRHGGRDGGPVLLGAAVEGPNAFNSVVRSEPGGALKCPVTSGDRFAGLDGRGAEFVDRVSNYPNTEPAIDLGASAPLLFSWLIEGRPAPGALGF